MNNFNDLSSSLMNSSGVNLKFHHDTISYLFFGQRYDICRSQKSFIIRFYIVIGYRSLRSIWDDVIFHTICYIYIISQKATKTWFDSSITELLYINIILSTVPDILMEKQSAVFNKNKAQRRGGNFKIKGYLNNVRVMNRCFHFAWMQLDQYVTKH